MSELRPARIARYGLAAAVVLTLGVGTSTRRTSSTQPTSSTEAEEAEAVSTMPPPAD